MTLISPNGRFFGRVQDAPDPHDYKPRMIFRDAWDRADIMQSFDMESNFTEAFDQSALGSCTANTGDALINYWYPDNRISRLELYYRCRAKEGTINIDNGAMIRTMMLALCEGAYDETIWPYDLTKFTAPPPSHPFQYRLDACARLRTEDHVLRALALGHPCALGFAVPDYFDGNVIARHGVMWMPDSSTKYVGGHAVTLVGYDLHFRQNPAFIESGVDPAKMPQAAVKFRNSWGREWGRNGYGWMPLACVVAQSDVWTAVKP